MEGFLTLNLVFINKIKGFVNLRGVFVNNCSHRVHSSLNLAIFWRYHVILRGK